MKSVLFSTALLASGIASAAVPVDGWYVSAFGGYTSISSNLDNSRFSLFSSKVNYDSGYNAGARIGFQSNPIRYEFEYTYINADVDNLKVNNFTLPGIGGSATANLLMANLYYDFPNFMNTLSPFIGVGIGYALMEKTFSVNTPLAISSFSVDRNAFAYQGMVGLTFNFSENFALNAAYRYAATTSSNGRNNNNYNYNNNGFGRSIQAQMGNVGIVFRFDRVRYK